MADALGLTGKASWASSIPSGRPPTPLSSLYLLTNTCKAMRAAEANEYSGKLSELPNNAGPKPFVSSILATTTSTNLRS